MAEGHDHRSMYAQHFQLTAEPFGLTPDPAFLYLSPEHREALAAVQYGILERRGFITLVGEVGTGKTTLLYSVLSQLGQDVQAAYVAYTAQSFEDLLAAVLRDIGAEVVGTSKLALIAAFNNHITRAADQGRTVALVIDEAQNLGDQTFEELRLLSNFETYSRKLVQVVLVGQPELQQRLRQANLRQVKERVSVRAFINPLPRDEMERYIAHRVALVGGTTERLFERRALSLIMRRAAGIPRRANILCHNALLFAYGRNLAQVTPALAREAVAEMDERRPGLLRRPALRRVDHRPALRRWGAAVAVLGLSLIALGWLLSTGAPPVTAEPGRQPVGIVSEPDRRAVEPDATASALAHDPERLAADADAEAAEPQPVAAAAADGVPAAPDAEIPPPPADAAAPAPTATQAPAPQPLALTVPPGATLVGLMRSLYGKGGSPTEPMLAEILRLNPQVKNVNLIFAGDSIRLPAPASGVAPAAGKVP